MATVTTAKRINLAQLTHELGVEGISVTGALGDSPLLKELTVEGVDAATLEAALRRHVINRRWVHPDQRVTEAELVRKARAVAAGDEDFTPAEMHALLATNFVGLDDLRTKTDRAASDLEAVKARVFGTSPPQTPPPPVLTPDPALGNNPILDPGRL